MPAAMMEHKRRASRTRVEVLLIILRSLLADNRSVALQFRRVRGQRLVELGDGGGGGADIIGADAGDLFRQPVVILQNIICLELVTFFRQA